MLDENGGEKTLFVASCREGFIDRFVSDEPEDSLWEDEYHALTTPALCGYVGDVAAALSKDLLYYPRSILVRDYFLGAALAGNVAGFEALVISIWGEQDEEAHDAVADVLGETDLESSWYADFDPFLRTKPIRSFLAYLLSVYEHPPEINRQGWSNSRQLKLGWKGKDVAVLYNFLGNEVFTRRDTMKVGKQSLNASDLFIRAIELDPDDGESWQSLSMFTPPGASVVVGGKSYQRHQCALKALELRVDDDSCWNCVGYQLQLAGLDSVEFQGTTYTLNDIMTKALELSRKADRCFPWDSVGAMFEDTEGKQFVYKGTPLTKLDCFLQALCLNPNYHMAMLHLGGELAKLPSGKLLPAEVASLTSISDEGVHLDWNAVARVKPKSNSNARLTHLLARLPTTDGPLQELTEEICYVLAFEKALDKMVSEITVDEQAMIPRVLEVIGDALEPRSRRMLEEAL